MARLVRGALAISFPLRASAPAMESFAGAPRANCASYFVFIMSDKTVCFVYNLKGKNNVGVWTRCMKMIYFLCRGHAQLET